MSNQYGDTITPAVDGTQLSRLHQTICDMNPVGVRTVFSSLPQPTHETLLGIYDITFGSGVEISIIKNDIVIIRYIQLDVTHNPLLETAMGGIVIRPSAEGYLITKNSPTGRESIVSKLSTYNLIDMVCKQWPKQLGWLSDICARIYPFAARPLPMAEFDEHMYPDVSLIELPDLPALASSLYAEQVTKYANLTGTTVNVNELRVNLTPSDRSDALNERGFVLVHRPGKQEIPLTIKTFNCEDGELVSYSRVHIEDTALPTLRSLDLLIENAIAMTPQNGVVPTMSDDLRAVRASIGFEEHVDNTPKQKDSLYNQVSSFDASGYDYTLNKSIIVRTTFHGRLTRIVIAYSDRDGDTNYLNQSFYSQKPLTGKDIAARACNIIYKLDNIEGNHVENLVKWFDSIEAELTKTFG